MDVHRGRALRVPGRRLAALVIGVTLSSVVVLDEGKSRCSLFHLAGDVGGWLERRWSAFEEGVTALRRDIARAAAERSVVTVPPAWRAPGEELIAFGAMRVQRRIAAEVLRAASATAVDPVYLMALADKESSFRPQVRASTSSAAGLFQFVEATWLEMLREFGPRHGLGAEARAVSVVAGRHVVRDPAERERLLALRLDPYLSAVMAAELLKRSEARIARALERPLDRTEWYLAHFLGTGDALRFLRSRRERPQVLATRLLPAAARANRALFTRPAGRRRAPLTLDELYVRIDRMMGERLGRYGEVEARARPAVFEGWE